VAQLPYFVTLTAFIVFVVATTLRIAFWIRLPKHVRWELYPVPHETKEKVRYGGSFMEETDWWARPRKTFVIGELKETAREILLLSTVREHNRKLWYRTFPFHFGLYLTTAAVGFALLSGVLRVLVPHSIEANVIVLARILVLVFGVTGMILGAFGAIGLLIRRLTLPELRRYTVPGDIFNLVFIILAFMSGLLTWALVDSDATCVMAFSANLIAFDWSPLPGTGAEKALPVVTVSLFSALIAYVPLTHLSHPVGKFFAYHSIRWNDTPNLSGGPEETDIKELLSQSVSWAAKHIGADGKKTWADLATANPTGEKR
jgi:nitrate reductase gamma subunit